MAFGITELINNITSSIEGLVADFTGDSSKVVSYYQGQADYKSIQSQVIPENWSKLSFPYTFAVVDLKSPGKNGGFSDFMLPLAPQAINQKEMPATNIRPTQGGTTVTHSGMGYKMLSISGTTGIAPFRGEGGVSRSTGEAIFQPKDLKHKSGYEVFIHLRNWFRTYYEFKVKQGKAARNLRIVFKNYKDGEFLIVELESFEMDRSAARPFLYDYKIEFKVLSHYSFSKGDSKDGPFTALENGIQGALDKINTARGVMLRSQGILRQIESTYDATILEPMRQATLALKAFLGVAVTAADIGSRVIVNTVSTANALAITAQETVNFLSLGATGKSDTLAEIEGLLDKRKGNLKKQLETTRKQIEQSGSGGLLALGALLTKVESGKFPEATLAEVAKEQAKAIGNPKSFYEEGIANLERVKQNAEDFFNLGSEDYDALFDRTATLNSDESRIFTDDEYDMLFAFSSALEGFYLILVSGQMFKSNFDERIEDMNSRFNGEISLQSSQAVRQVNLTAGATLERIALEEMGDSSRWGEIVEVNSLKAPYVSDDPFESRDGVLKPGDKLLIPMDTLNGFSSVPEGKENKLTKNMNQLEKSLGVDLKLTKDFDLSLSSSGDLELVGGAENLAQATLLKLSYEPGDILEHPTLGAGIRVGKKFPPLQEIKDGLVNTLLQDSRINRVTDLSIKRESSALYISFNLFVKNIDIPIPVKIKV